MLTLISCIELSHHFCYFAILYITPENKWRSFITFFYSICLDKEEQRTHSCQGWNKQSILPCSFLHLGCKWGSEQRVGIPNRTPTPTGAEQLRTQLKSDSSSVTDWSCRDFSKAWLWTGVDLVSDQPTQQSSERKTIWQSDSSWAFAVTCWNRSSTVSRQWAIF